MRRKGGEPSPPTSPPRFPLYGPHYPQKKEDATAARWQ